MNRPNVAVSFGRRAKTAPMVRRFEAYLRNLRTTPSGGRTAQTGRVALEGLLNGFAAKARTTTVQPEPKGRDKDAPAFKLTRQGRILGYVETQAIGEDLDRLLRSDQIARYKSLSQNVLLTDCLRFIWITAKNGVRHERLCNATDLEDPRFRPREDRAVAVSKLLEAFVSTEPKRIDRAQQLALALAARSKLLRDYVGEEVVRQVQERRDGRLYGLFQIFRNQVFHELTLQEFADAVAQMLSYGLFLARLNADSAPITLHNARQCLPGSFRLMHELVDFLIDLETAECGDVQWVVEEVLSTVNGLDLKAIREDPTFRRRRANGQEERVADEDKHRRFERDPFIYFYEDYLRAYDRQTSKGRGVYYTPPPIVTFIVGAVDDILKGSLGIRDGLADHRRVTVLDFACGTGTFLLEACQRVFETVGGAGSDRASLIVREHLLKNLFGFECLIAPYAIAHLKLSQYLQDHRHPLKGDDRLQVFLGNALEPLDPLKSFLPPAITADISAAPTGMERPILVIIGNPPYARHSKNKGAWITAAIDGYKFTIETDSAGREIKKPLGERNPKSLNDDYVKFIRFAQLKIDAVERGVAGIITNHSWLDNATFRGMRQSLMRSFEQIYVLDLHGCAKKKERAPDGSKDENVFGIEQGVAISLFVKWPGLERGVWRGNLWGRRLEKYRTVASASLQDLNLVKSNPTPPHFFYHVQDDNVRSEYERGLSVSEIMPVASVGFVTGRDHLAIAFTEQEIEERVSDFIRRDTEDARLHYKLGEDVRDWRISWAQEDARNGGHVIPIHYRPFDSRYTFYTGRSRGFHVYPRDNVSRQLLRPNLALITSRLTKGEDFRHAQVADKPAEVICMSPVTSNNAFVFPLRAENDVENFSPSLRAFLDSRYERHYAPEEILGYIYAILNAPTYRARYAEFLRIDFPRVPFPDAADDFESLSRLGWALVQAHLLRALPRRSLAACDTGGDHRIEIVRYSPQEQTVWINKTQRFKPVPEEVWQFQMGGYQVLDKFLRSRKGRVLSPGEITHVGAIADSLAFTIEQMSVIDTAYRAAFPPCAPAIPVTRERAG